MQIIKEFLSVKDRISHQVRNEEANHNWPLVDENGESNKWVCSWTNALRTVRHLWRSQDLMMIHQEAFYFDTSKTKNNEETIGEFINWYMAFEGQFVSIHQIYVFTGMWLHSSV